MKYHVEKSKTINASSEKVFNVLMDFHQWPIWSPWLIMEPNATVNVSKDGKSYSWEGELVGKGEMKVVGFQKNHSIDYDLKFERPFKSKAKVQFILKEKGEEVEVTWLMDSSLPLFLFWMKKMIKALIGMDYDRGLSLLKDYCEKGWVESKIKNEGFVETSGFNFIGLERTCDFKDIGPSMEQDFGKLMPYASQDSAAFSIYHNFDPVKGKCVYTAAVRFNNLDDAPKGFVKGTLGGAKALKVSHVGPYHHLGNAWSLGMTTIRTKKYKQSRTLDPIEFYVNDPLKVAPEKLETHIYFPMRS